MGSTFEARNYGRKKDECLGMKGSKHGYIRFFVTCNLCTGKKAADFLKDIEEDCKDACMVSNAYCKAPSIDPNSDDNGWGGKVVFNGDDQCGEKLPECLDDGSSSSETLESSSSEELSSSSENIESSCSEEPESSSSEENAVNSSDSEQIKSSSSDNDDDDYSSSSGIGERGTECYYGSAESCRSMDLILFKKRPVLLGDFRLYYHKPYCEADGNIVFRANIPVAYYRGESFFCMKKGCVSSEAVEGAWQCDDDFQQINGCSVVPEHRSIPFYYSVLTKELKASWGIKVDFSSNPDPNLGMSLPYFEVSELLKVVADAGVFEGDGDFDKDLKDLYPQFSINSFDDYVRACAYHLNIDVSSSSEVGSSSSSSSLFVLASSSSVQSSSSEESSSSIGESSSSENSSSSVEMEFSSSSDETESSSSNGNESSSSLGDEASSSSLQIESSSSEFVYSSSDDGCFVPGGDQVHSPNQIFSDCLDNMEDGKCYSINPARGTQYGWMNTDAQDRWWWREVDCETGEKVDRNRVGACPGFPLDNVPSNPKHTCIAYNGKCYRCKSENSYVDCSQEWLWKWSFSEDNIGSWYAEVDCYNPRYEGNVAGCLESKGLYKASIGFDNIVDGYDDVVEISSSKKYDAKGRMIYIGNETHNKMPQYRKVIKKELVTGIYSLKDNLQILSFVMVHGHVKASIKVLLVEDRILERIGNAYNHLCKMRIITNIEEVYYSDQNSEIIQHEKEHERIYRTLEFVEWNEKVSVQSSTIENQCEELKKLLWNKAKKKIEEMLNAQNEWDDSDPKNECNDRIDVKKELKKLEDEFYFTIPCYPCTVK